MLEIYRRFDREQSGSAHPLSVVRLADAKLPVRSQAVHPLPVVVRH